MGASSWQYRVPHTGSVEETLIRLQEQILAGNDYLWPWGGEENGPDPDEDFFEMEQGEDVPRPSSLAELNAAKEIDEFWEEGTHTILDISRVITAGDDEDGAIRLLTPEELNRVFGTGQPSAADFGRVYLDNWWTGPLGDLLGERWTGRGLVIYEDGAAAEVFFWGASGD
jgi:hypothetical protein